VEEKNQHGGPRAGAGRKPLTPGEKVVTASVSMPRKDWDKIDSERGEESRGRFIARIMRKARIGYKGREGL
tara:strand:+ start:347 stop:559 length:213 start_codon:yes stop_codon:yes gene_type:complete